MEVSCQHNFKAAALSQLTAAFSIPSRLLFNLYQITSSLSAVSQHLLKLISIMEPSHHLDFISPGSGHSVTAMTSCRMVLGPGWKRLYSGLVFTSFVTTCGFNDCLDMHQCGDKISAHSDNNDSGV